MKSAVIVFPASNCDRDAAVALEQIGHAAGRRETIRLQGFATPIDLRLFGLCGEVQAEHEHESADE